MRYGLRIGAGVSKSDQMNNADFWVMKNTSISHGISPSIRLEKRLSLSRKITFLYGGDVLENNSRYKHTQEQAYNRDDSSSFED